MQSPCVRHTTPTLRLSASAPKACLLRMADGRCWPRLMGWSPLIETASNVPQWSCVVALPDGGDRMETTALGLDLTKNVFQLHGVDAEGHGTVRKAVRRQHLLATFAKMPPCLIGVEACASAHHWARKLQELGHTVRLMAPQFVKPYVKTNKNDAADAEAICEALRRPNMRFVPVKSSKQQAVLSLHRARQGFVKARTAQANQIRGLLAEFGIVIPQGICHVAKQLPLILEDGQEELPGIFRQLLQRLGDHLKELDRHVG